MTTEQVGFNTHIGKACPLDQANVDTDQIIPKQFLTSVSRLGFGKNLFFDWRYLNANYDTPNPEFVLNQPQFSGASILLTLENFGCGSSREHAPWALDDYGFKVIIAPSFADIFYGNCINNQILPVVLDPTAVNTLIDCIQSDPDTEVTIDLPQQVVTCGDLTFNFDISAAHKFTLTSGLDTIGQTLLDEDAIAKFEASRHAWQ